MQSIYSLSLEELKSFLNKNDQSIELAQILFQHLYKNKITQSISAKTIEILKSTFNFDLPTIETVSTSPDGTIKFLMKLHDGKTIETVLIPFHKRFTVCLSSQVGCAMKCSFCYTGTMGLSRHLKSNEIIGQYVVAANYLAEVTGKKPVSPNIVFMGQGEPLHNSDEVLNALTVFMEPM